MIKTYIPAPNFSMAPPPDGPVDLGHVLYNLARMRPLNRGSRIEIRAQDLLPPHEHTGFEDTRKRLTDRSFGICASLLSIFGVGCDVEGIYEKHAEQIIRTESLRTLEFVLTDQYIHETLRCDGVQSFMKANEYKQPIYIVTGLKIAVGASVELVSGRSRGMRAKLTYGFPGVPVDVGPSANNVTTTETGQKFQESTFVLAIEVEKIKVKEQGFNRKPMLKGAMYDTDGHAGTAQVEFLRGQLFDAEDMMMVKKDSSGKDYTLLDDKDTDGHERTQWVIPSHAMERSGEGF